MAALVECPSLEELSSFVTGALDRVRMDEVASHIVRCDRCESVLSQMTSSGLSTRVTPQALLTLPTSVDSPAGFRERFQLGERLGAGGMGHVFRAEQISPIRRTVAVKVLKPGLDTTDFLGRFETERQAVARMDHPNIARLYEAGLTDEGRPYFALELIPGDNLVSYADQRTLNLRERVALFLPVCRAVQHAHQKGVIHRDLKPSNVLVADVDGTPIPKVIDFGIAKAVREENFSEAATRPGLVVGTPEYMSPEQAAADSSLDIDTRSDIFTLGVLLYELLTGTTPFTVKTGGGSVWDLLRTIRDVDAPRPSTKITAAVAALRGVDQTQLRKLISGDLEWILLKALARDRDQRYPTANALAADLERYLANEAVSVGPPSHWYRAKKFIRRNRTAVLATSIVVIAILTATVATVIGLIRSIEAEQSARESEQTALTALARETQARAEAVESDRQTRVALTKTEAAEKQAREDQQRALLAEVLANEQRAKAIAADAKTRSALFAATDVVVEDFIKRRRTLSRDELNFLKRIRDLHSQILVDPADDPLAYFHSARRLGAIHDALGAFDEAELVYKKVTRTLAPIAADRPNDTELHLSLARGYQRLGIVRRHRNDLIGAESAHLDSAKVCESLLLRSPGLIEAEVELARAHANISQLFTEFNPQWDRAEAAGRVAVMAFSNLATRDPLYRRDQGVALFNLAQVFVSQGKFQDALRELRASIAVREPLARANPDERFLADLARAWSSLGTTLQATNDLLGAEAATERCLDFRRHLADQEPGILVYQVDLARSLMNLATIRTQLGWWSRVEEPLARAAILLERASASYPTDIGIRATIGYIHVLLSKQLQQTGEEKLALGALNRGLEFMRVVEKLAAQDENFRQTQGALLRQRAVILSTLGRHREAADDCMAAQPLTPLPDRPLLGAMLAECVARGVSQPNAEAILRQVERIPGPIPPGVAFRLAVVNAVLAKTRDDKFADRAVELLGFAVNANFKDVELWEKIEEFAKLADREDYQKVRDKLPRRESAPLPRRVE